jgi:uncharacterized membrane protein YkvA (DUF1232 family)
MSDLPPEERPATREENRLSERAAAERAGALRALLDRGLLTWRLLWDSRVGFLPKLIPLAALVYVISPFDLISEVLVPALGPLVVVDDIGLLIGALTLFIQASPPDVVREHLRALGARVTTPPEEDDDVVDGYAEVVDE